MLILLGILAFFIVYVGTYIHFAKKQQSEQPVKVENQNSKDDTKPLLNQLNLMIQYIYQIKTCRM
ncbi:hypothetical protein H477_4960 [[Clostridium] sordellii ATCC 9714]|nr:hypothetical protein H477_4960 [[Clostridium] sordellii ATCC 9714] [Paeniclostridium sordellii ATCC 9714]